MTVMRNQNTIIFTKFLPSCDKLFPHGEHRAVIKGKKVKRVLHVGQDCSPVGVPHRGTEIPFLTKFLLNPLLKWLPPSPYGVCPTSKVRSLDPIVE
ncbi:hypothetical protein HGM15179_009685, partial [Zosterops borbonicus]